jgi:hypothetical protein
MTEAKIRIRIKRGTDAEWTSTNPILGFGEIGWITDMGKWFCGNGVDTYSVIMAGDGSQIWWSKEEVEAYVQSQLTASTMTAIPFDTNHATAYGNQYVVGDLVYYAGNIYKCKANNDSIVPTSTTYWDLIGAGFPSVESPIDWNATTGNNQILNKPTFVDSVQDDGSGVVKVDNTDPLNPIVQFNGVVVDGTTINGDGSIANPLSAVPASGFVESVSDDGNGVATIDNTDPLNPILNFKGVFTDGVTMSGDGTSSNPLFSTAVSDTFQVLASAMDSTPAYLDTKIIALDSSILFDNSVPSALQLGVVYAPMVVLQGINADSVTIDKGDPVYFDGTQGASNTLRVKKADASDAGKMPSVGIAYQTSASGLGCSVVVSGIMTNVTTDPIDGITPSVGKTLYVKAGGGLTTTKPTGANLIQNIGKVGKVSGGNSGSIVVSNIQRTNDIPNIADTKIWIGNASGVPTAQSLSGDVTMANSGAVTIANDAVTYAKIQNVSSTKKLLGRVSAGAGDVEEVDLSGDGTLGGAGASGSVVSSQAAVKNYVDVGLALKQDTSAKNTANGYAGLDASTKLSGTQQTYGTTANTACEGNDSRLSDARTPSAHASSHTNGTDDIQTANASQKGLLSSADWSTFNGKQDTLVSGTNIKTINGASVLGSGDIATGYTLSVQALTSSPTDAQTIYFGNLPKAPTTTANTSKVYIRRAGNIKIAEVYCYSGTAGTNENWSMYIRKNNSTDTLIATLGVNTNERVFSNTALNIAVAAGDYIEIKCINPTWATNPLTTIFGGYLYIEE